MKQLDRRPWLWLVLGAALLIASQARFGVGVLAWLAPVPWLRYLRLSSGWRARSLFLGALMLAYSGAFLKIITAPLTPVMAVGFGVPIGLVFGLAFCAYEWIRQRLTANGSTLAFGALMVLAEWALHGLLPFGTWGSAANTQLDQLALLQLASVTGLHGISFLMYLTAAVVERALNNNRALNGKSALEDAYKLDAGDAPNEKGTLEDAYTLGAGDALNGEGAREGEGALKGERLSVRRWAWGLALASVAIVAFGQARLALSSSAGVETLVAAAVGTDSRVGAEPQLPDDARLAEVERGLVARTEKAARAGAELVVWNEAATMVRPHNEAAFVERMAAVARRLHIELVAAYVVPTQLQPLRYENKYIYLRADGSLDHRYLKHHPVPGEPAVRGTGPMPVVVHTATPAAGQGAARSGTRIGGSICYDYDFPRRALANAGVDLVALPSSDWRGIDPIHTEMARLRAIESGHSIVRSTRFGLSAGIDAYGRMRGHSDHFDSRERVLVVRLPRAGVTTLYGQLGDWFPLVCLFMLMAQLVWVWRRERGAVATSAHSRGAVRRERGAVATSAHSRGAVRRERDAVVASAHGHGAVCREPCGARSV